MEEQNSSIQEKTNLLIEHSQNRYEELKAILQTAEQYREEEKRKYKLKINGLEYLNEGKVIQAGKILKALEKGKHCFTLLFKPQHFLFKLFFVEKKEKYGQKSDEPQKPAKTASRTSQRIKK